MCPDTDSGYSTGRHGEPDGRDALGQAGETLSLSHMWKTICQSEGTQKTSGDTPGDGVRVAVPYLQQDFPVQDHNVATCQIARR